MLTPRQKELLAALNPKRGSVDDPEVQAAIQKLRESEADQRWLAEQQAFDAAFSAKSRELPVPSDLAEAIIRRGSGNLTVMPGGATAKTPLRSNVSHLWFLAAAALFVMGLALTYTFLPGKREALNPGLASLSPGVNALITQIADRAGNLSDTQPGRDYGELVGMLEQQGVRAPREVPCRLPREAAYACQIFQIDGAPVAMVCFRQGEVSYHLFAAERDHYPEQGDVPEKLVAQVGHHALAIWTSPDRIYVLAAEVPPQDMRQVL